MLLVVVLLLNVLVGKMLMVVEVLAIDMLFGLFLSISVCFGATICTHLKSQCLLFFVVVF